MSVPVLKFFFLILAFFASTNKTLQRHRCLIRLPQRCHKIRLQWVPVALLVQALLFYLPCLFWRVFSDRSGINVNNLVEAAETIQNALYPERREKTIRYMIRHLDYYLDYQRDYRGGCCDGIRQCLYNHTPLPICGNRRGNYLVALYMSAKILYIINVVGQIFLLNLFLGGDFHMYGVKVVRNLMSPAAGDREREREVRNIFPRVTWCDFNIHQVGTVHTHTVQCVLPINFFNEKIYLFLWFWLAFVATATTLSFLRWLWVIVVVHSRNRYVRKHLKIMDRLKPGCDRDRKLSYKFAERYLRQDGVFVLKLVAKNSTDLVVADIVAALWDNYRNKPVQTPAIVERVEIDNADPTSPDML